MKYAWIDERRGEYGVDEMCRVLDVSESGYRSWKRGGKPYGNVCPDTQMPILMQAIHAEFKGSYGIPRMIRGLRARSYPASEQRAERLMRENGIKGKHKRRFRVTTDSKHNLPIAPNPLWTATSSPKRPIRPGPPNHLSVDRRGLAVSGDRHRPVQLRSRGLVTQAAHDGRHCD